MTTILTTPRRFVLAAAAFGLASFGLAGAASAQPVATASVSLNAGVRVNARTRVEVRDHRTVRPIRPDYRHDDRIFPSDPYWRAMRMYDVNRNRLIDTAEKKGFWTYMASQGVYGSLSGEEVQRFGQLGYRFDVNRDGRLIGMEKRGMDKLIDSLRLFDRLDYNNDNQLTAHEAGFSALAPRFRAMDRNGDRLVSKQEVRDEVLRAYRAGEC